MGRRKKKKKNKQLNNQQDLNASQVNKDIEMKFYGENSDDENNDANLSINQQRVFDQEDLKDDETLNKLNKTRKRKYKSKAPDITIRISDQYTYVAYENWKKNLKRTNPRVVLNDELNQFLKTFLLNENKRLEYDWLNENQDAITDLFKSLWLEQNKFYWDKFNELIELMYSEVASNKLLIIYLINNLVDKKVRNLMMPSKLELNEEWLTKSINTKVKYRSKTIK
ncbi:hypothetical protein [[Mycoplasma] imitans]|uniref:hypothetical protein n=1 Tax=[Mycoplasma] imitans TaxID=29560 RepID=UPI000482B695|nr:hypothetical protein [[Mycoplasma] imitans]